MRLFRKHWEYYKLGKRMLTNRQFLTGRAMTMKEARKKPPRSQVINFLLSLLDRDTRYLEIGVRHPSHNFNRIEATWKYGVDPGLENERNPVDFKMTSDRFFSELRQEKILKGEAQFDLIFIDGLHLAEQVDRDIENAFEFLKEDGFIVLHDCNPPTEWHSREEYRYFLTPAEGYWNGTTWKAFLKWRFNPEVHSCCVDSDWGVGILSKRHRIGDSIDPSNIFFEHKVLAENRLHLLNLVSFDELKKRLGVV